MIFGTLMQNDDISRHFFIFFKILIFWVVFGGSGGRGEGRGVKRAKNGPKWQKNSVCTTPFLRNHTWYGCHFWCRCINCQMISPDLFFYFFKILVLRVVKEVKGKKIFQNDKNIICPALLYLWKVIHHRIVIYGTRL